MDPLSMLMLNTRETQIHVVRLKRCRSYEFIYLHNHKNVWRMREINITPEHTS